MKWTHTYEHGGARSGLPSLHWLLNYHIWQSPSLEGAETKVIMGTLAMSPYILCPLVPHSACPKLNSNVRLTTSFKVACVQFHSICPTLHFIMVCL